MWISALCIAGFILILSFIGKNTALLSLDQSINTYFKTDHVGWGYNLMYFISLFASTIFVALFTLAIGVSCYVHQKKKEFISYCVTLFPSVLVGFLIKDFVQRIRPENLLEKDYSFPSLHATASVVLYGWLAFYYWKLGKEKKAYLLLCVPLLIGFSRIYLGVHWFSDVLGGFLLGAGWLLFIHSFDNNKISKLFSFRTVKR